jgi:hypothetical protein
VREIDEAPSLSAELEVPLADPTWHPLAIQWYSSLTRSGQSYYYEASDWATALLIAESISQELNARPIIVGGELRFVRQPPRPGVLGQWLKASTALLATEGDRRRSLLELQRQTSREDGDDDVTNLDDVRARLARAD